MSGLWYLDFKFCYSLNTTGQNTVYGKRLNSLCLSAGKLCCTFQPLLIPGQELDMEIPSWYFSGSQRKVQNCDAKSHHCKARETSQHSGVMYNNQRAQINDLLFSHALRCEKERKMVLMKYLCCCVGRGSSRTYERGSGLCCSGFCPKPSSEQPQFPLC